MGEAELKAVVMLLGYSAPIIFFYFCYVEHVYLLKWADRRYSPRSVLSWSGPPDLPQQLSGCLQHKFNVIPPTPSDPAIKQNGGRSSAKGCFFCQQTEAFAVKIHDISLALGSELDQCYCWYVLQKY